MQGAAPRTARSGMTGGLYGEGRITAQPNSGIPPVFYLLMSSSSTSKIRAWLGPIVGGAFLP